MAEFNPSLFEPISTGAGIQPGAQARFENISDEDRKRVIETFSVVPIDAEKSSPAFDPAKFEAITVDQPAVGDDYASRRKEYQRLMKADPAFRAKPPDERRRFLFNEPAPKSIKESIVSGVTNLPGNLWKMAKSVGKAAITQPEEGMFDVRGAPRRLKDFGQGLVSGVTAGMLPAEPATSEAQAARQLGGQAAGFAVPFTGAMKGLQALQTPRLAAEIGAGAITGAAAPLSQGDIPGAVENAVSGVGTVGLTKAPSVIGQAARAGYNALPSVKAKKIIEATKLNEAIAKGSALKSAASEADAKLAAAQSEGSRVNDLVRSGTPIGPEGELLAKQAAEAQRQLATSSIQTNAGKAKAELDLAQKVQSQRGIEKQVEGVRAASKPPDEIAVGRVADSMANRPIAKKEAGEFFQSKYRELRKEASKEGSNLYDEAAQLAGDTVHERIGLVAAVDKLMSESGTIKTALSSKPQRIARELNEVELPYREGTVAPTFRTLGKTERQAGGGRAVLALDEDFYSKYKSMLPPRRPGEPERFNLDLWRDLVSGKLSEPRATVGDMIVDRQKIRAAKRAANDNGHYNEGRQLAMLEDGITADMKMAGDKAAKEGLGDVAGAINRADGFWRDEYIPKFGYKALPNKGSMKSPEDVVSFFFRKDGSQGSIQAAESLQSTLKTPADVARIGRAWIDNVTKKSVDPKTGEFSADKFATEYLAYPDRVREIAAGGPKAKAELDGIIQKIQEANRLESVLKEGEALLGSSEKVVKEGARDVARVAGAADMESAAKEVARLGKEQAALVAKVDKGSASAIDEAEGAAKATGKKLSEFQQRQVSEAEKKLTAKNPRIAYLINRGEFGGLAAIVGGAAGGNINTIAGGALLIGVSELGRLMASPGGRHTLSNLMSAPKGSKEALTWAVRASTLLRNGAPVTESNSTSKDEPGSPENQNDSEGRKNALLQKYGIE